MTDTRSLPPDDAALAAELALGLLDGEELAAAATRAAADPLFGAEVARWRGRLAPLLDDVEPVAPPASAWSAIQAAIGPRPDNVLQLKRSVRLWRGLSAGATALAASLALVLLVQQPASVAPPPPAQAAPMVAALASAEGEPMLMATWDPMSERLVIAAAKDMPAPKGQSHQVWLVPAGGKPMPVGMMPGARMHMELSDFLAEQMRRGATIAISVEPMGGSPTGRPTGPVVASGTLERS